MKFLSRYRTYLAIPICIALIGLSGCDDDDNPVSAQGAYNPDSAQVTHQTEALNQIKDNLTQLSKSLVWQDLKQCNSTFSQVINNVSLTEKNITTLLTASNNNNNQNLNRYIQQTLKPKLADLSAESTYLRERCAAADYDATGVSLERPDMLAGMLSEWKNTLSQISNHLDQPPVPAQILPASRINANITQTTKAGTQFKDCTDSFCQTLTVIPAGTFQMGGSLEEQNREGVPAQPRPWELPQHHVSMNKAFAIGTYEVTLAQFKQFQKETAWETQGCRNWETQNGIFNMYFRDDLSPISVGFAQTDSDPVVCVRREDGREFAKWLSVKTGQTYHLPTEAEWEYAARAGTTTTYFWGNDPKKDQACKYANVLDRSTTAVIPQIITAGWSVFQCSDRYAYTAPVGQFIPNKFGLYDMTANAREWVDDCWHANYEGAPTDGSRWGSENKALCNFPVLRGGSWIYNTYNARIAYRNAYLSSQARSNMWGFRLVRDIS